MYREPYACYHISSGHPTKRGLEPQLDRRVKIVTLFREYKNFFWSLGCPPDQCVIRRPWHPPPGPSYPAYPYRIHREIERTCRRTRATLTNAGGLGVTCLARDKTRDPRVRKHAGRRRRYLCGGTAIYCATIRWTIPVATESNREPGDGQYLVHG